MSLRSRLALLCSLGLLVTLIAAWILIVSAGAHTSALADQRRLTAAITDSGALLAEYQDEETGVRGYMVSDETLFLQPEKAAVTAIPALEGRLRTEAASLPGVPPLLAALVAAHQSWATQILQTELTEGGSGNIAAARALETTGAGKALFDQVRAASTSVQEQLTRLAARANSEVKRSSDQLRDTLIGVLTVLVLLILGLFAGLVQLVLRPLAAIGRDVHRVAGGDLDKAIGTYGPAELQALASGAEAMRLRMCSEMDNAVRAAEALNQQSPAVVALRQALTPNPVKVPGLEVATRLDPAEGVIAGDWVDAVALPQQRLGIVMGDVAGHGAGPAVFAMRLKIMLASALAGGRTPGGALGWVCQQIGDEDAEMFATVFIAILDPQNSTLTYANAGHPDAYLLGADLLGADDRHADPVPLPATGPLLSGLLARWAWGDAELPFPAGAVCVALTDGVLEARDSTGRQYGTGRLLESLDTSDHIELDTALETVLDAVRAYSGARLIDDCSLIAVRHLG